MFVASVAIAEEAPIVGPTLNDMLPSFDSVRRMPIDGVNIVEMDGKVILTSNNGRFVFTNAVLYDTWNRRHLRTPDEIAKYMNVIDTQKMGLDMSLLGAIKIGSGEKVATFFVDPQCEYCAGLLQMAISDESILNDYSINLVLLPILGEESGRLSRNLICANIKGQMDNMAVAKALAAKSYDGVANSPSRCDDGSMERAIISAKLFGAQGVPFVINPEGRYGNAVPTDLRAFLEEGIL